MVDFIESRQVYKVWKTPNNPLEALAKLSNDDKHRTIYTAVAAIGKIETRFECSRCHVRRILSPPKAPILESGAVLAALDLVFDGPDPEVKVAPKLSGYIALDDRRNVVDVLREIRAEVTEILNAPEIAAALP